MPEPNYNLVVKKNNSLFPAVGIIILLIIIALACVLLLNKKKEDTPTENPKSQYTYYTTDFSISGQKAKNKLAIAFNDKAKVIDYNRYTMIVNIDNTNYYFDTMPITVTPKDEHYYNDSHRYKEHNIEKVSGNFHVLKNFDDTYSIFYELEEGEAIQSGKNFVILFGTIIGKYTDAGYNNHLSRDEALKIIEKIKDNCLILSYTDNPKEAKDSLDKTYDLTEMTTLEDYFKERIEENYNISGKDIKTIYSYSEIDNKYNDYKSRAFFTVLEKEYELTYEVREVKEKPEGEIKATFTLNDIEVNAIEDEKIVYVYNYNDKDIVIEDTNGFGISNGQEIIKDHFTK